MRATTVLIIDDDEHIRTLLRTLLAARGYAVAEAFDGEEGLALASVERPDVVLLDLDLPGQSGIEVLDALKCHPELHPIPVVVLSGSQDSGTVAAALDAGAHDFVRKPCENDELTARVDAAVRSKLRHDAMAEQRTELERLATIDDLCALPNRRALDAELRRQVARAERSGQPFAVLMIDVDHFKLVNDEHGHAAGDEVLREIADRLRDRARRGDVVGRWGGEEFVIVMPDSDDVGAAALAEALLAGIRSEPVGDNMVTASAGIAVWERETAESLIARADAALYEAKAAGRDRVHASGSRLRTVA